MATRFDPFSEMDRLLGQMFTSERSSIAMPMDLYRVGDHYVLHVDLPGADPGSIDVNVNAPKGTGVRARSGGLFKHVAISRQTQMEPAATSSYEE